MVRALGHKRPSLYNPAFKPSTKKPATMTAAAINKERDALDKERSRLGQVAIAAGRGHERYSDRVGMTDPLARAIVAIDDRAEALYRECERRYGKHPPAHLPLRGYGPRES